VPIFGAIVHQQEDFSRGDPFTESVEKPLRLTVDPVQVLKDEDEWLVETLAQKQFLESVKRAPTANLGVHLL
jgi:hypothetical protein